jgi:DNA-binding SARP family transcriptional activator/tetratricopeptide (TPR) repeat protein
MRVRLLGPVDVCVGEACHPVSGLRRKAVIAVLALHPGEVVSTDRLADVLWGDEPPATARNTLQRHVSHLRGVLGSPAAIVARAPGYLLDPAGVDTDVGVAERLIRDGATVADRAHERQLGEALALWRGPALADLDGLPWLREQAEYLQRLHLQGVRALTRTRLALGEHERLLPELEALTGKYPFDEQLHAQLMLALYRSGRQADALAAYRHLRVRLDDDLGIEPGQPLRDLEAAILRQEQALDISSAAVPLSSASRPEAERSPAAVPEPEPTEAGVSGGEPMPLLERAKPLATLKMLAAEARRGTGRLVLVGGEAGAGKSALLERFQRDVPDARWSWGACDGLFTPRPLGPLFDLAKDLGGPLLKRCAAGADREELFRTLLHQICQSGKLSIVVVEDIHWADEATLDLLSYLGRRLRDAPVLLVASYRDDGVAAGDPLQVAVGDLAALRWARRITLAPLSARAVEVLAAGSRLAPAELFRLTGGNPFYVSEVLQAEMAAVPLSARDAVLARAARLGPEPRELLDVAALTGSRVEVRMLKKVTGCSPAMLDEVLASGLLSGAGGWVRFRHEIARLAVAGAVTAHRSQAIHERVLAALQSAGCTDDARLAFHAEAADDGPAVMRYAPAAAHQAAGLGAHREAVAQFERALRFAAGADRETLAALYQGLAEEAELVDRWQEAADAQERALTLRRETGDRRGEGYALIRLARLRWNLSLGREAFAAVKGAISVLEPLGPGVELARAYAVHANLRMLAGDHDAVAGLVEQALHLAGQFGATSVSSDALNTLAMSNADAGLPPTAQLRQALDLALSGRHHPQAARAYHNLSNMLSDAREFAKAEPYLTEGIAYCEEHDMTAYGTCLRIVRAEMLERTGHWDEAAALCSELQRITIRPVNLVTVLVPLAVIAARRGQPRVWNYLDQAVTIADSSPQPSARVYVRAAQAEAHWLDGKTDAARREAELVYGACQGSDPWELGRAAAWLGRTGSALPVSGDMAEPFRLEFAGDAEAAAAAWIRLGCPYDAAMALASATSEDSLRESLRIATDLGAEPLARIVSQRIARSRR